MKRDMKMIEELVKWAINREHYEFSVLDWKKHLVHQYREDNHQIPESTQKEEIAKLRLKSTYHTWLAQDMGYITSFGGFCRVTNKGHDLIAFGV